jgi:DNA-binding transcriptional ArsR family regulator
MREGPDISRLGALIGDPARAVMLQLLSDGRALTPSELADAAGVTQQTVSSHLARLKAGGLIEMRAQGRHRYVSLAGAEVAEALEALMGLAARIDGPKVRTGPRDPDLRRARVCYDHLAGGLAVRAFDSLSKRRLIAGPGEDLALTRAGEAFLVSLKIAPEDWNTGRRRPCRACLDWSERRSHLAGGVGAALLQRVFALNWAGRDKGSRIVRFTPAGVRAFEKVFPV